MLVGEGPSTNILVSSLLKTNRGTCLPHLNCLRASYRHSLLVLPSWAPPLLRTPLLSVSLPPPPQTLSAALAALLPGAEDEVAMGT